MASRRPRPTWSAISACRPLRSTTWCSGWRLRASSKGLPERDARFDSSSHWPTCRIWNSPQPRDGLNRGPDPAVQRLSSAGDIDWRCHRFRHACGRLCDRSETGADILETGCGSTRTGHWPGARPLAAWASTGRGAVFVGLEVNPRSRLNDRKQIADVDVAVQLRRLFC